MARASVLKVTLSIAIVLGALMSGAACAADVRINGVSSTSSSVDQVKMGSDLVGKIVRAVLEKLAENARRPH